MRVLAFTSPDRSQWVLTGMNTSSSRAALLNIDSSRLDPALRQTKLQYYRTSEDENCVLLGQIPVKGANWPFTGIELPLPPDSIFTLTT